MENKYKFIVTKEIKEEVNVEVEYGIHYYKFNQDYYRIDIQQHKKAKTPVVDIIKVMYDKGLDTKIMYTEAEFSVPYRFSMFLAGEGCGNIITRDEFLQQFNAAVGNINEGLSKEVA